MVNVKISEKKKRKKKQNKENNNNNNKMDGLTNVHVQRAATVNQNCNLKKKPFPFVPVRFCHFCFFFVFTVCPETEETLYTDQFFESQDIVVNALDNVEARRYMDRSESLNRLSL